MDTTVGLAPLALVLVVILGLLVAVLDIMAAELAITPARVVVLDTSVRNISCLAVRL